MPGGAYSGGRKSEIRATAAEEASGGEGNDFVPGATHFGGWSEIGATVVKGASGGEMSDIRPGATYFGGRGSGIGATAVKYASGAREGSDFGPGGTSLGGGSGIEATAVEYASGGERSDFRPDLAYSGRGRSGFGATVVREAFEDEGSDFLRASRSRRGASPRIFLCLSLKIFSFVARDDHLQKSLSTITRLEVSESSKESSDCEAVEEIGAARLLGSGRPRFSGRSASRDMGPKGRSSRKNFVSGSTYLVMSVLVAS